MRQSFNASNTPDTCLWCGRKLPHKYSDKWLQRERKRLGVDSTYTEVGKAQELATGISLNKMYANKGGNYGDGFFCGLSCGYEFAVVLAEGGRRLKPKQA